MRVGKNKKIIVAISGGVDSSVAAALLKRAGFNLAGVFMKFWSPPETNGLIGRWNRCCSPEAEKRARQVAQILGIPFYVFNFEKEFKKKIVDYFLAEYKAGRTPNPCVVCNKEIKFGLLLEKALALGADFVATGHYARLRPAPFGAGRRREIRSPKPEIRKKSQAPMLKLLRAKDKQKDQSYFLWQLSQKQLKRTLFPIGDYTKKQVRALAKKFGLPTAEVKESQEVCFIKNTTENFLREYLKEKPGDIVTLCPLDKLCICIKSQVMKFGQEYGKVIGRHKGLWFYTIGQRKGLGLSGGPFYVVGKDTKKNLLIVSKNEKDLEKKELIAEHVNWISGKPPRPPLRVKAKIRYKSLFAPAKILKPETCLPPSEIALLWGNLKHKEYKIVFAKPQRAITPGQSVVFYKNQELLGGGVIV